RPSRGRCFAFGCRSDAARPRVGVGGKALVEPPGHVGLPIDESPTQTTCRRPLPDVTPVPQRRDRGSGELGDLVDREPALHCQPPLESPLSTSNPIEITSMSFALSTDTGLCHR